MSIINLNVKGLNNPNKRPRLVEWIQNKISVYAVYKRPSDTYRMKVREGISAFHVNGYQKKAGITILRAGKQYSCQIEEKRRKE